LAAIRAEPKARERGGFLFLLWSGKQLAISPTAGRPNITKFAHKTLIYVAMNPFRKHL